MAKQNKSSDWRVQGAGFQTCGRGKLRGCLILGHLSDASSMGEGGMGIADLGNTVDGRVEG